MSNGETQSLQKFVQGDALRNEMSKVLPKHVTPERMARIAWTAIVRNPDLAECDRNTLATAILLCAQAGLEPDGRLAHLVPFGKKVQVIFDYKGLLVLAKRNGVDAKAILVREKDDFEYLEDDGTGKTSLRHSFNPCADRGAIIGVYSRASEAGKSPDYEFMSIDEVDAIRKRSRAGESGPWKTDTGEMVKKTVIKRHSKRWDLLPEIRDVINAEDDTPPPLNAVATSRPIFEAKQLENGVKPEPEVEPGLTESKPLQPKQTLENPTAPPQTAEAEVEQAAAKSGFNVVKAVRNLCKEAKIKELVLIGFLTEIGSIEPGIQGLEELAIKYPAVLQMVSDQFADISKRIIEATKAGVQP